MPGSIGGIHEEDLCNASQPDDIMAEIGQRKLMWHIHLDNKVMTEECVGNAVAWLKRTNHAVFLVHPSGKQCVITTDDEEEIIVPNEFTMLIIVEMIVKKEIRCMQKNKKFRKLETEPRGLATTSSRLRVLRSGMWPTAKGWPSRST